MKVPAMEFSEHLWNAMVDHVKVHHDGRVVFRFKNGDGDYEKYLKTVTPGAVSM